MKKSMRAVATLIAAASAVAAIVSTALDAHADSATNKFLADEHAAGFFNVAKGDAGLIAQGMLVCNKLDQGTPLNQLTVAFATAENWSVHEAVEFMGISIRDLCPQHMADVKREAEGVG
jgi:hypothetical protein